MSKLPQESDEETTDIEHDDDMFNRREQEREARVGVTDFVRRAIENTVGSVQNTSSLSREALTYLLQQGDKGRKEALRIVAKEVGDFLRHVDISTEVIKVLTNIEVDLNASVKFKKTGDTITPEISKQSGLSVKATGLPDEEPLPPIQDEEEDQPE